MRAGPGVGVGGCGQIWARWAKVGRSGWVRLIDRGWVTWIVGGCGYACRYRAGLEITVGHRS